MSERKRLKDMNASETEAFASTVLAALREQSDSMFATDEHWYTLVSSLVTDGLDETVDWIEAEAPSSATRENIQKWIAGLAALSAIRELQRLREMRELNGE